jgi:hypothetical protein
MISKLFAISCATIWANDKRRADSGDRPSSIIRETNAGTTAGKGGLPAAPMGGVAGQFPHLGKDMVAIWEIAVAKSQICTSCRLIEIEKARMTNKKRDSHRAKQSFQITLKKKPNEERLSRSPRSPLEKTEWQ